jgi:protein gp37
VSTGCANCWAKQRAIQNAAAGSKWYDPEDPFKPTFHPARLGEPVARKKPSIIAVGFMGDLFHEDQRFEDIRAVIQAMRDAPQHAFLVLTKRPERIAGVVNDGPDPHIWYGTTVEDAVSAGARGGAIRSLAQRGHKTWISAEPLIGDLDALGHLQHWFQCPRCAGSKIHTDGSKTTFCTRCGGTGYEPADKRIGWVVVGCESGPNRRRMDEEWVRKIRAECARCRVPFYLKQMEVNGRVQSHPAPMLDGREYTQVPLEILRHVGRGGGLL